MACRHVHVARGSPPICSIMDEASGLDDDDDSIAGRWVFGDVDASERALVRDLLVPLMCLIIILVVVISLGLIYARIDEQDILRHQ